MTDTKNSDAQNNHQIFPAKTDQSGKSLNNKQNPKLVTDDISSKTSGTPFSVKPQADIEDNISSDVKPFGSRTSPFSPPTTKPKDSHAENLKILQERFGEEKIKEYEPMTKHTTFRIGGPAEFYFEAQTIDELIMAIALCRDDNFLKRPEDVTEEDRKRAEMVEKQKTVTEKPKSPYGLGKPGFGRFGAPKQKKYQLPFTILGGGSNMLVSDRGIPGLTIKIAASKINIGAELIEAYAGTMTGYILQKALDSGLTGMEFLDGVPGTIGGAVYNNAKAFFLGNYFSEPRSISSIIYDLTVITKDGRVFIKTVSDYKWSLTHNNISETGDVILVVRLKLKQGISKEAEKYLEEYHAKRREKPYMKFPSAGSVFRNPDGASAGKLIDQCGLKGKTYGKAQIAPEHGNIFINLGGATALDVRKLIDDAKREVWEKFRIRLSEEIKYIGDFRTDEDVARCKEQAQNHEKEELAVEDPFGVG